MLHSIDYAVLITGFNILGLTLSIVVHTKRKSRRRVSQLEQAAILLQQHADNLEKFLSDRDAPVDLKAVLIGFSDALADQGVANDLAESLCGRQATSAPDCEDTEALMDALEQLRARRSDLADLFIRAVGSGIGATLLRWPKAARAVEVMAARMVADPRNEIAAAAEGARLWSGLRFGMRASAAAA
jgi:hypothetical protein